MAKVMNHISEAEEMTMMLDRNGPGIGLGGKTPGPGHPEP
jgi:hypothetical protein